MSATMGRLITIEGTEGVGKSTVIREIRAALEQQGVSVLCTREPGGTPLAESIRSLLLADHDEDMLPLTELLLMFASRNQHINQYVKPALLRGEWVVSDRFTDASFAYQGGGRELPLHQIESLAAWVQGDCVPDLTLLLDAPVEVGLERMAARGDRDRIEKEGVPFFKRIRDAYLARANAEPTRFCLIDATQSESEVISTVQATLDARCREWL